MQVVGSLVFWISNTLQAVLHNNMSGKHRIRSHASSVSCETIIQGSDKRDRDRQHDTNSGPTSNQRDHRAYGTPGAAEEYAAVDEVDGAGGGGSCSGGSVSAGSNCGGGGGR
jgi:hypothetical protein